MGLVKHKVKVPRVIRIGSLSLKVILDANLECEHNWGHHQARNQKILVTPAVSNEQKAITLCHEMLHVGQQVWAVRMTDNDVERLSYCLAELLSELGIELDWRDIPVVELKKR